MPQQPGAHRHPPQPRAAAALHRRPVPRLPGADPVGGHHPPPAAGEDHRLEQRALHSHQPQGAGGEHVRPLRQAPPGQDRPQHRHQDGPHRQGLLPRPEGEQHRGLPLLQLHPQPDPHHQVLWPPGDPSGRPDAPRLPAPRPGPHPAAGGRAHPHGAGGHSVRLWPGPDAFLGPAGGRGLFPAPAAPMVHRGHPVPLHRRQHRPPTQVPGARSAARSEPHPALRRPTLSDRVWAGSRPPALPHLSGVRPGRAVHPGAGVSGPVWPQSDPVPPARGGHPPPVPGQGHLPGL